MLEIDGAHGEGGGQLLRMAAALSALQEVPIRVVRIRAGRPNPGLAAQHVAALRAVGALCGGQLEGLAVGSTDVVFRPGPIIGGRHAFDVGTAGSVTLVLQACLPVALAAAGATRIRITGGTDVRWSPSIDYFARVFLPLLRGVGGHVEVELLRRGYFPRGGGVVEAVIEPARAWNPFEVTTRGPIEFVRGVAHVANLPEDIPKRMSRASVRGLHGIAEVKIEERRYAGEEAVGQGGGLVLSATAGRAILGAASLAERGKTSERVGEDAARELLSEIDSDATLDVHAADQLLIYLAKANGPSHFVVRDKAGHLETVAWLLQQFLPCRIQMSQRGRAWNVSVEPQP